MNARIIIQLANICLSVHPLSRLWLSPASDQAVKVLDIVSLLTYFVRALTNMDERQTKGDFK
jgi:hypothetical protein